MFNVALWKSPSVDLISDFQLQIEILQRIYFIFSFWLKIIFMKNFSWKFEKEKIENRVNSLENLDWKLKIRNDGYRKRFSKCPKIIILLKKSGQVAFKIQIVDNLYFFIFFLYFFFSFSSMSQYKNIFMFLWI